MVPINYSGNVVEWTDGEWARLREIKDAPGWSPNDDKTGVGKIPTQLRLSLLLMERAKRRAADMGISFNTFVEGLLKVIIE